MSEYCSVKTEFKNSEALVHALAEMKNRHGHQFNIKSIEYHEEPKNLLGYTGDVRKDVANIIIRRVSVGGSSNDLGFIKNEDGTYTAIVSEFDKTHYNQKWMGELKQNYAFHAIRLRQESMGRKVTREKLNNGHQRVRIQGYR